MPAQTLTQLFGPKAVRSGVKITLDLTDFLGVGLNNATTASPSKACAAYLKWLVTNTAQFAAKVDAGLAKELGTGNAQWINTTGRPAAAKLPALETLARDAKSTANTAQGTANTAKNVASTAQNTANSAKGTANAAQKVASAAQNTANTAKNLANSVAKTATNALARADRALGISKAATAIAQRSQSLPILYRDCIERLTGV
jgi:methyl-accepting chemotaxis protein